LPGGTNYPEGGMDDNVSKTLLRRKKDTAALLPSDYSAETKGQSGGRKWMYAGIQQQSVRNKLGVEGKKSWTTNLVLAAQRPGNSKHSRGPGFNGGIHDGT